MRRAAGVRDGLDGAELVTTVGRRLEPPEALEVLVSPLTARAPAVEVDAVVVDLPNLDRETFERFALEVKDTT